MKLRRLSKGAGFTLVELLVVVVIIAALAAVAIAMSQRMMNKAKANLAVQNIRQIAPIMTTYASDNQMKLPPVHGPTKLPDGTQPILQWSETCLAVLFPNTELTEFKKKTWWDTNKTPVRNPMFRDKDGWSPQNPGFAMNAKLAENIATSRDAPVPSDPLAVSIPLATIDEPARAPLIAPNTTFTYVYDSGEAAKFDKDPASTLLSAGQVPILFVDGHVESMTPREYSVKKLDLYPEKTNN